LAAQFVAKTTRDRAQFLDVQQSYIIASDFEHTLKLGNAARPSVERTTQRKETDASKPVKAPV
jgi:hypothetical protein